MRKWLGVTVVLAFCSIIYELLLATSLSVLTGSYIWWHSWTIAFYITGLSVGSFLASKKLKENAFIKIELWLSILGISSLFLIQGMHWILYVMDVENLMSDHSSYAFNNEILKGVFFAVSQLIVLALGALSGYEIPLVIKKIKDETGEEHENKVIAYNYFGTLIGTIVFSMIFIEKLNLLTIGIVVGSINLLICLYLLWLDKRHKTMIPVLGIFLVGIGMWSQVSYLEQIYFKTRYYFAQYLITQENPSFGDFMSKLLSLSTIERDKSLYQHIDFVKSIDPKSDEFKMFLDNNFQLSTHTEKFYHDSFAHVSMNFVQGVPKKVLVLGAGDGMLIRELLKYSSIETITHIELDEKIVKMFKQEPLNKLNNNSLNNPKVKTIIGDGFYFVRNSPERFDAVYIDFPYPKTYDLSRLYSIEFYQNVRRILTPDGFAVMDVPLLDKMEHLIKIKEDKSTADIDDSTITNNDIVMSTVYYSGFRFIQPFRIEGETFVVMKQQQFKTNYKPTADFLKNSEVVKEKDLADAEGQKFPYSIDRTHINSIFFPKLVDGWSLAPIY